MEPLGNELWKCFARSGRRRRALVLFSSMGEMYQNQAARMLGVTPARLRALLYGDGKSYAAELGLVTLGLVREKPTVRGRAWEITTKGRRKARSMAAAGARRASADAWRRIAETAEEKLAKRAMEDVAMSASADRWRFTWSVETEPGGEPPVG